MEPRIIIIVQKQLIGHTIEMSLVDNKTQELFSGFMPLKKHIANALSDDIYEVMIYTSDHFKKFDPANKFIKWAAIEVNTFADHQESMQTLNLQAGLYAVFTYKGLPKDMSEFMQNIFMKWLPMSSYQLDDRPHFNVLGAAYKNNHPDSEEDIYIPIKLKD